MTELDLNAVRAFCIAAHGAIGQKCKVTGEPYSRHPERLVVTLRKAGLTHEGFAPLLAGAFLHDVLEDTQVTREMIEALFGREVTRIVVGLTDVYTKERFPTLNRKARKHLEHQRLGSEPWDVQTVKCADIIDNAGRLKAYPDKLFATSYVRELDQLLRGLTRADDIVRTQAEQTIAVAYAELQAA